MSLQDTDKPNGGPGPRMVEKSLIFNCPEAFEPTTFVICAIDAEGKTFSNAPVTLPHVGLHLATKLLDFCSQQAVLWMQKKQQEESPIIPVRGQLPPWPGPREGGRS